MARAQLDAAFEARCLNNLGVIANLRGDREQALADYQLALAAYQQAGLVRGMAETHHNIAISWRDRGDYGRALESAEQAVRLARLVNDDSLVGLTLGGRAAIHLQQTDSSLAAAELERAAEAYHRVEFESGLAEVWRLQAAVLHLKGDRRGAVALLERAAALARDRGSASTLADIERDLGGARAAAADAAGAREAWASAAAGYRRLGAMKAAKDVEALLR
jgi:tetratricopeptide (TPR) repeat protein